MLRLASDATLPDPCVRLFDDQPTRLGVASLEDYLAMAKRNKLQDAQSMARRGETEQALTALWKLAEDGNHAAAISVAELEAFRGNWPEVIRFSGQFLTNPDCVYAGNVFNEHVRLIALAAHETSDWDGLRSAAEQAAAANAAREYSEYKRYIQENHARVFRELFLYADRQGAPPQNPLHVLAPDSISGSPASTTSRDSQRKQYEQAISEVDTKRPDLRENPDDRSVHFFQLAMLYEQTDEAIELYRQRPYAFRFDHALYVAREQIKRGQSDAAWPLIEEKLPTWWPVDLSQVAPVELLIDEQIRQIMNCERCAAVLALPRGPEATQQRQ